MAQDFTRLIADAPDALKQEARSEALRDNLPPESCALEILAARREIRAALDRLQGLGAGPAAFATAIVAAELAAEALTSAESDTLGALIAMTAGSAKTAPDSDARAAILDQCTRLFLQAADGEEI